VSGAKGFFLVFAAVYVVLASGGLFLWGPPSYSAEYMADHKDRHEQYLAITKSTLYKQYTQHGDATPEDQVLKDQAALLAEQAAFVVEYEATLEFKAESKRRAIYNYYFGFLNAGGLMLIAFRFGRAPITGMLDAQIAEIRGRLDRAAETKAEAMTRFESAQARIGGLEKDEQEAKAHAATLMARERDALAEGTEHALAFIDQETEDRKNIVGQQAIKTIRKELVEQAAVAVSESYQSRRNVETEAAEIDSFIGGLTNRTLKHAAQESVS
jgi:F0F1-type ATP synthase membrane subunit b/b'